MKLRTSLALLTALVSAWAAAGGVLVEAQSGIVIDAATGKVLWSKDADAQMYPASTTKIMTALIFLEATKPDEVVSAPADVELVTGSSLYLKPDERVTAGDLAYAILLRSANDACYAAAVHVAGTEPEFVKRMNERAKELGCTGTNFTNPHGLHDPMHYTTARDLAIIAREAMKNEVFARIASTESKSIWRSLNTEDTLIKTHNKFLEKRPEATGVKTGWTVPAGRCFVGSASRGGMDVITVVLKSQDWLADTEALTDWTFQNFERKVVLEAGTVLITQIVKDGTKPNMRAALAAEVSDTVPVGSDATWTVTSADIKADLPVQAGDPIGTVTLVDGKGQKMTVPVVSADTIERKSFSFLTPLLLAAVVGTIVGVRLYFRRPYRRW